MESQSWLVDEVILKKNVIQPQLEVDQEIQKQVHQLKSVT